MMHKSELNGIAMMWLFGTTEAIGIAQPMITREPVQAIVSHHWENAPSLIPQVNQGGSL